MAAITATNITNALKQYYRGQLSSVIFGSDDRPVSNMLKKHEGFVGSGMPIPVYYEDAAGGRSFTYSTAVSNAASVQVGEFLIDVVPNNQIVEITRDALLRGRSEQGTFLKNQILRVNAALNNLANDIEIGLFRDATGKIGTVSSPGASTTLTLGDAEDARNFYIGQKIVFAANTASALRDSGATLTVNAVDFVAGTLTVNANVTTITGITNGDAIFTEGDYTGASQVNKISGFDRWLTGTGTLFGQDRSLHSRLQGVAATGSLADIKKAITDTASLLKKYSSSKPDVAFVDWSIFSALVDQLEADVMRTPGNGTTAGFSSVQVFGPSGPIKVVGATHCPNNKIYILQSDVWEIVSMGPLVTINMDDGQAVERLSSESGVRVHADSHSQLACRAPAKNAIVTLS